MPTKLSRYFEGVMEACWLAAVILVPVFFNVYSSRIFEPDKIALLRSLALVTLAAWVIKLLAEGGPRWEKLEKGDSALKALLRTPLIVPVLALAAVYVLSTLFSVTPRVSLWGSYQRLQGTYSTLSYIIIFLSLAGNLRRKTQVERLITTAILASLPVTLYGVLQRYQLDPVPWGGNVSNRIAANMGNAIFVAAYMIMVIPLTAGRIAHSFRAILKENERLWANVARATGYVFILALQVVAIVLSGSRGPMLGFLVGLYFLLILLTLRSRLRWLSLAALAGPLLAAGVLYVMQIPNGPLKAVCDISGVGRFCHLLDAESNSALVRKYIWEGALDLVSVHEPIAFPDGSDDPYNVLRPLVGYGPESMYVAYNPFYIPELGQVEKRNASPDRSHNETWDSIVITGGLGLAAYLAVFLSVFYFGFRWLGLVENVEKRILFFILAGGGAVAGVVGVALWRGLEYIGVGLPFGLLIGIGAYLAVMTVFAYPSADEAQDGEAEGFFARLFAKVKISRDLGQWLTLTMLLAAVFAHYAEINFGIAIAVTRTYFWVFAGLLLLVGYILPRHGEYGVQPSAAPAALETAAAPAKTDNAAVRPQRRRTFAKAGRSASSARRSWVWTALASAAIVTILLMILGYDYLSRPTQINNPGALISSSLTRLPGRGANAGKYTDSLGILALVATTWLMVSLILTSEQEKSENVKTWLKSLGVTLGISLIAVYMFWSMHAASLINAGSQTTTLAQVDAFLGLLAQFYVLIFVVIALLALTLPEDWPGVDWGHWAGLAAAAVLLPAAIFAIDSTNLRIIQADTIFKQADLYTREDTWQRYNLTRLQMWRIAETLYKYAIEKAPDEDYYYLFLGRAYHEQAKSITTDATIAADAKEPEMKKLIETAVEDLKQAQEINPLNTDHTANLARLYSWFAQQTTDPAVKAERAATADQYYATATTLSPHNSNLWVEWYQLYMDVIRDYDAALERITQALTLDQNYALSQAMLGNYYLRIVTTLTDTTAISDTYRLAVAQFEHAADVTRPAERADRMRYLAVAGDIYTRFLNQPEKAIETYEKALAIEVTYADRWKLQYALGGLYLLQGNKTLAMENASAALAGAPETQKATVQALVTRIEALP